MNARGQLTLDRSSLWSPVSDQRIEPLEEVSLNAVSTIESRESPLHDRTTIRGFHNFGIVRMGLKTVCEIISLTNADGSKVGIPSYNVDVI